MELAMKARMPRHTLHWDSEKCLLEVYNFFPDKSVDPFGSAFKQIRSNQDRRTLRQIVNRDSAQINHLNESCISFFAIRTVSNFLKVVL